MEDIKIFLDDYYNHVNEEKKCVLYFTIKAQKYKAPLLSWARQFYI